MNGKFQKGQRKPVSGSDLWAIWTMKEDIIPKTWEESSRETKKWEWRPWGGTELGIVKEESGQVWLGMVDQEIHHGKEQRDRGLILPKGHEKIESVVIVVGYSLEGFNQWSVLIHTFILKGKSTGREQRQGIAAVTQMRANAGLDRG